MTGNGKKQYICHPVPLPTQDAGEASGPITSGTDGYRLQQRCTERPSGPSPLIPGLLMIKEEDGGGEGKEGGGGWGCTPPPPSGARSSRRPAGGRRTGACTPSGAAPAPGPGLSGAGGGRQGRRVSF